MYGQSSAQVAAVSAAPSRGASPGEQIASPHTVVFAMSTAARARVGSPRHVLGPMPLQSMRASAQGCEGERTDRHRAEALCALKGATQLDLADHVVLKERGALAVDAERRALVARERGEREGHHVRAAGARRRGDGDAARAAELQGRACTRAVVSFCLPGCWRVGEQAGSCKPMQAL